MVEASSIGGTGGVAVVLGIGCHWRGFVWACTFSFLWCNCLLWQITEICIFLSYCHSDYSQNYSEEVDVLESCCSNWRNISVDLEVQLQQRQKLLTTTSLFRFGILQFFQTRWLKIFISELEYFGCYWALCKSCWSEIIFFKLVIVFELGFRFFKVIFLILTSIWFNISGKGCICRFWQWLGKAKQFGSFVLNATALCCRQNWHLTEFLPTKPNSHLWCNFS